MTGQPKPCKTDQPRRNPAAWRAMSIAGKVVLRLVIASSWTTWTLGAIIAASRRPFDPWLAAVLASAGGLAWLLTWYDRRDSKKAAPAAHEYV